MLIEWKWNGNGNGNGMGMEMAITFASFACKRVVVVSGRAIAADEAQFFLLARNGALLLLGISKTVDRIAVDTSGRGHILTTCTNHDAEQEEKGKRKENSL